MRDQDLTILAIPVLLLGLYFVREKVKNDSQIARDTARAANALELIAQDFGGENKKPSNAKNIQRRQPTKAELDKIDSIPVCSTYAFMGSDNQIHPDYCW